MNTNKSIEHVGETVEQDSQKTMVDRSDFGKKRAQQFMINLTGDVQKSFAQFKDKFMQLPKAQQLPTLKKFNKILEQSMKNKVKEFKKAQSQMLNSLREKVHTVAKNANAQFENIIKSEQQRKIGAPNWVMILQNLEKKIASTIDEYTPKK